MFRNLRNTRRFQRTSGWVFGWVLGLVAAGMTASVFLAPVALADDANHLVISGFLAKTRSQSYPTYGSPFIRVTNPTASDIDLSHVYITDGTTSPSAAYFNITLADPSVSNPGGGTGPDFHAKFPQGFSLDAGMSVVVSLKGSNQFELAYGRLPDFELFEDDTLPDEIPELVEAFPGSINVAALEGIVFILDDGAESLVLYQWDGIDELVQDLDYVIWGSDQGVRVSKTGVTIGSSTYLDDTAVGSQIPMTTSTLPFGRTYQRVSADEGSEELTGGNGLGGHDETSENLSTTWALVNSVDPGVGLSEPFPAAPVVTSLVAYGADISDRIWLFAAVEDFGSVTGIDFYYSANGGGFSSVPGLWNEEKGYWVGRIPAQSVDTVVSFYCVATNEAGGSSVYPVAAPTFGTKTFTVKEGPPKLLISEVSTGRSIYPFSGMAQISMEFIEIHNPGDEEVDLSDYYLTDAISYASSSSFNLYWRIAEGTPTQPTVGGGNYNDFIARFPEGYTIAGHATITISMADSWWYEAYFDALPDLELYEDGLHANDVPEMRPVFQNAPTDLPGNSIYTEGRSAGSDLLPKGIPELEEFYGEPLILFHYVDGEDLVTDIDVFVWGTDKTSNFKYGFDKSGINNGNSTYQDDTPVLDQDWYTPVYDTGDMSYTRVDFYEGLQTQGVGNGTGGRDETSENWNTTFETLPFSPGFFMAGGGYLTPPATLVVQAKTFNPYLGERFPLEIVARMGSEVRLRVFDREGRLVTTLFDSRFDGLVSPFDDNPTRVNWDGRSDTSERVKAGLYILHFSVVDETTGTEEIKTFPVVVATRLSN